MDEERRKAERNARNDPIEAQRADVILCRSKGCYHDIDFTHVKTGRGKVVLGPYRSTAHLLILPRRYYNKDPEGRAWFDSGEQPPPRNVSMRLAPHRILLGMKHNNGRSSLIDSQTIPLGYHYRTPAAFPDGSPNRIIQGIMIGASISLRYILGPVALTLQLRVVADSCLRCGGVIGQPGGVLKVLEDIDRAVSTPPSYFDPHPE